MIKEVSRWFAWIFWWIGDRSYDILCYYDQYEWWVKFWYPIYNKTMLTSSAIQEKVGGEGENWPWEKPVEGFSLS